MKQWLHQRSFSFFNFWQKIMHYNLYSRKDSEVRVKIIYFTIFWKGLFLVQGKNTPVTLNFTINLKYISNYKKQYYTNKTNCIEVTLHDMTTYVSITDTEVVSTRAIRNKGPATIPKWYNWGAFIPGLKIKNARSQWTHCLRPVDSKNLLQKGLKPLVHFAGPLAR